MSLEGESKRLTNDGTRKAMKIRGNVIGEVKNLMYLGSFVQLDGGFVVDVK